MSETAPTPTHTPEAEPRQKTVRIVDAPLAPPSANLGLVSVFQRRYLLKLLVQREVQARYQGSFLGFLWSYINPLSQLFIFWFVMGYIMKAHQNVEHFAIHIFSAMVVVHFFTETFNSGVRSIVRNKALVSKLAMPYEMFPVAAMLVSLYHVGPQLVVLLLVCLITGWAPDPGMIFAIVLALGIIMTLGIALALLFSIANVYFRDFGSAVSILTNFVRFGVPMVYPYSQVSDRFGHFAHYYLLNPIAEAVLLMQRAFWVGTTKNPAKTARLDLPPHLWLDGLVALICCAAFLVVSQLIFTKCTNRIPERL